MTTHSVAKTAQDMPRQDRDASGHLKDIPDGYTDLVDTHRWGLWIFIFLVDIRLSIREL